MISIEQAFAAYAEALRPLPLETIGIANALQRVLAESVAAATDLPRFDQSAMDGYAFNSASIAAASAATPHPLPIVEHIAAGAAPGLTALPFGCAARILTGAPLPPGVDTVIPQERIQRSGDTLLFDAPWPADRNIRRRGEELCAGAPIASIGARVTPGLLASLISAGIDELRVRRQPTLRLLVTGDEVRPLGSPRVSGRIPDSNGPFVQAVLARWGLAPPQIEYVGDRMDAVREALVRAFAEADIVISTGGASVGDRDFLPATAEALGLRKLFWKVAQKPGKPLYCGVCETGGRQRLLLALPGNPGAVMVGMVLHLRRIIDILQAAAQPQPRWASGILAQPIERDTQRARLVRMQLDYDRGQARLTPLPNQDSHMLSNLAAADVLVWIEAGTAPLSIGEVLPWTALP